MSAAETLRNAAMTIRDRADAADVSSFNSWRGIGTGYREEIKDHIQLWSPDRAEPVAELLLAVAQDLDENISTEGTTRAALAVANQVPS